MRKTKIIFWGFPVLLACAVMAAFAWFPSAQFVDAQTTRSDEEIRKRNRDKSVTDEKLVRVRDEASAVQASVFTLMKAEFLSFRILPVKYTIRKPRPSVAVVKRDFLSVGIKETPAFS